ncbi:MAG TPA: glycosyltransferase family 2 protein [Stellaceae bacterium]|nr:glycosyltransferase family 2 protein [Stellaceae bacterium]
MSTNSGLAAQRQSASFRLSAVVPCFNEEAVLAELHARLTGACQRLVDGSYEIILVNDGSSDGTWSAMTALASRDAHVVAVNLARNYGHQLALTAGLRLCRGDRVLVIDADLQDPPELLAEMMALMDGGANVVYGQRLSRDGEGWLKQLSASLFYRLLARMTDVAIPRDTGEFRLMDRKVVEALNELPEQFRFIRGMVSWIGFRQVPLPYERQARFAGASKYPFRKMLVFAFDAITGFSTVPLRLSTYFAMIAIVAAALLSIYVVYAWLFLAAVKGWASTLLPFLVFSGIQLLVLGLMGEYVGRIYMETKRRPLFIIDEIVVNPNSAEAGRHRHGAGRSGDERSSL